MRAPIPPTGRFLALVLLCGLAAAPARAKLSPTAEKQLELGVSHLYNLDYAESREAFRTLIELEPDDPFGYLFESGGIWWQSFMEAGLFKSTPTLQGLFERDIESAIEKAKPLIKSKDSARRAEGYFASGMALGTRGQWEIMRGQWVKAYFDGRKAIKHLRKCVRLDKKFYDAYLGIGVYDYQVAHFKGALKLAILVGVHGSEARGLKQMRLAMDKGRYSRRQAAAFLSSLYIIDLHDHNRALKVLESLRKSFPDSPYFMSLNGAMRYRAGDWSGSVPEIKSVFDTHRSDMNRFDRKLLSLICGLVEKRCLDDDIVKVSIPWFDYAIENAGEAPGDWLALLHLYRGHAADTLGHREDAMKHYKIVISLPKFWDFHSRAKECLKTPCDKPALLEYMKARSQGEPWPPKP